MGVFTAIIKIHRTFYFIVVSSGRLKEGRSVSRSKQFCETKTMYGMLCEEIKSTFKTI